MTVIVFYDLGIYVEITAALKISECTSELSLKGSLAYRRMAVQSSGANMTNNTMKIINLETEFAKFHEESKSSMKENAQ
ncbi:hypothetical protein L2E82_29618 [Cichorium intybus]|uniref:Uncharacterized protein n=1 Tax=Cichorium intybus TaxID=13427 RepID=A0ACB9CY39_CICIN|nr:hypothetical protein L2E82_29618 [Cichorium intybus]